MVLSVLTPTFPTHEFDTEASDFEPLSTRKSSFYGEVFGLFASGEIDVFSPRSQKQISADLEKEGLKFHFGWVLGVMWCGAPLGVVALAFFITSGLLAKEQQRQEEFQR